MRSRPALLLPALITLAFTTASCSGPSIYIPPTPLARPAAQGSVQNHQHGQGGPNTRLVTRYGGPVAVAQATQPDKPQPQAPFTLTYTLQDKTGDPVTPGELLMTHERIMHTFIVSRDLSYFAHVHPQDMGGGRYGVSHTLPYSGNYVLYDNFYTSDGNAQIERHELATQGAATLNAQVELTPTLGIPQQVDGLTVMMTANLKARRRVPTTYTLAVQKDGSPVTDLEPYLGAVCHVVIVSADTKQFEHTHGDAQGQAAAGDMSSMGAASMGGMVMPTPPARFGPNLQFTHTFMQAGSYKIWVQFMYKGRVTTVAYNVQIGR